MQISSLWCTAAIFAAIWSGPTWGQDQLGSFRLDASPKGAQLERSGSEAKLVRRDGNRLRQIATEVERPRSEVIKTIGGAVLVQSNGRREQAIKAAVRDQLRHCRRPDTTPLGSESAAVRFAITFNRDGTVRQIEIQDLQRFASDSAFRKVAEDMRRTVLTCAPYRLPDRKYATWKRLELSLDPSRLFGE